LYLACQDRLLADKRKAKAEGRKLGSCYWAQLKQMYSVTDLEKVLLVKDPTEMVQPKLIEALKQATSTNTNLKSKSLLTTYFAQGSSMNQKELCGVIKHLLRSKVKGNTTSCKCMLQFMKFVMKAGLYKKYPEELDVLRDQFDEAPMQRAMPYIQPATNAHSSWAWLARLWAQGSGMQECGMRESRYKDPGYHGYHYYYYSIGLGRKRLICVSLGLACKSLGARVWHARAWVQEHGIQESRWHELPQRGGLASQACMPDPCTQAAHASQARFQPAKQPPISGAAVELGCLEL
jgi:hypothetical protein